MNELVFQAAVTSYLGYLYKTCSAVLTKQELTSELRRMTALADVTTRSRGLPEDEVQAQELVVLLGFIPAQSQYAEQARRFRDEYFISRLGAIPLSDEHKDS